MDFWAALVVSLGVIHQPNHVRRCKSGDKRKGLVEEPEEGSSLYSLGTKVKVTQLCPTLWNPKDYIVYRILQARILEWVAIPFSEVSSQPRDQTQVSHMAGGFFLPVEPSGKPFRNGLSAQYFSEHFGQCPLGFKDTF